MEIITKYRTIDGVEFHDQDEALKYESVLIEATNIMSALSKVPDTTSFSNGHGFLQHDEQTVTEVRKKFFNLISGWLLEKGHTKIYGMRFFQEVLNPYSTLIRILNRFDRMDDTFKEYGQQYFANHPNEAKQIQLN